MTTKKAIIWGAGKIGRGFAADVFGNAGYDLVFWDTDQTVMKKLQEKSAYTVLKLGTAEGNQVTSISNYSAYTQEQYEQFEAEAATADVIAVSVFQGAFDAVAATLIHVIEKRRQRGKDILDIVILANTPSAGESFKRILEEKAGATLKGYIDETVGISEAIVIRMAVNPTEEMLEKDELVVATNGYPVLYIDGETFKGEKPEYEGIEFVSGCRAWEQRKLFTYNMIHALCAYMGGYRGNQTVCDCMKDTIIFKIAQNALDEVGQALRITFGFSDEEMRSWNERCLQSMRNEYLNDRIERVGSDPVRKLKSGDRLAGAALLCKTAGVMPYWLTKIMAYAFMYRNEADCATKTIAKYVAMHGVKQAAKHFCGFEKEAELCQLIADRYEEAAEDPKAALEDDARLVKLYKEAWSSGFNAELQIRGCAQGTLFAAKDTLQLFNEDVFNAATAFSAGMGMCGDGPCGGYSGSLLLIGMLHSRSLKDFYEKNKVELYKSFDVAQELHDKFVACYNGVSCRDVHNCIYSKAYTLRDPAQKAEFEEVGAHRDKCTTVIGMTQYMILQVFREKDPALMEKLLAN